MRKTLFNIHKHYIYRSLFQSMLLVIWLHLTSCNPGQENDIPPFPLSQEQIEKEDHPSVRKRSLGPEEGLDLRASKNQKTSSTTDMVIHGVLTPVSTDLQPQQGLVTPADNPNPHAPINGNVFTSATHVNPAQQSSTGGTSTNSLVNVTLDASTSIGHNNPNTKTLEIPGPIMVHIVSFMEYRAFWDLTRVNREFRHLLHNPLCSRQLAQIFKANIDFTEMKMQEIPITFLPIFYQAINPPQKLLPFLRNVHKVECHNPICGYEEVEKLVTILTTLNDLEVLDLGESEIKNEEAIALAKALGSNASLKELVLSGNEIEDKGAEDLAKFLKEDTSLQKLYLDGNNIEENGAAVFAEALKTNTSLKGFYLDGNHIEGGTASFAEVLEINTSLQELGLGYNNIQATGAIVLAEALKKNTSLRELCLDSNSIETEGATMFAEALKINTTLQRLYINNNFIGTDGVTVLVEALELNSSLEELRLDENNIGADGVIALARALKMNTSLRRLHLNNNAIGAGGVAALAEALKLNSSLEELRLDENNIGADGVAVVTEALKVNTTLQRLHLKRNELGDAGAKDIADVFKANTSLQELDLSENKLKANGVRAIIEAWISNIGAMNLQEINLMDNIDLNEMQALSISNVIDKLIILSQEEILTKDLLRKTLAQ